MDRRSKDRRVTVRELEGRVKELERLVEIDPLTNVYNRRGGERRLVDASSWCERMGVTLSLALVDVDLFKVINDTQGHAVGDALLRDLASIVKRVLRRSDAVARWGGEEFLLVLPGLALDAASALSERLRAAVESKLTTTISIGVSEVFDSDWAFAVLQADRALYAAKNSGRNCVREALR